MAREAGPPPARIAVEAALLALEPAWTIRAGWQWGEPPDEAASDYLLLHVRKGIALIDAGGSRGDGGTVLARFLEHQGFSSFFPGTLPIVEVVAATAGPVALAERLEEAFAAAPALTIAEPDWAAAARMLVAAAQAPEPPALPRRPAPEPAAEPHFAAPAWTAAPAAPAAPEPEPVLAAPERRQRRWPMAAAAVIVALAGAAGAWMELGSRTAPVAKLEVALPPAATADKVAAAPPSAPSPAPPPAVEGNDAPAPPPLIKDTAPPPALLAPAAPPPLPARKPVPAKPVVRPAAARPREAPRPITRLVAAAPIASARRDCRAYSAPLTVLGRREAVTGIACRGPDGTWQLVSEAPR